MGHLARMQTFIPLYSVFISYIWCFLRYIRCFFHYFRCFFHYIRFKLCLMFSSLLRVLRPLYSSLINKFLLKRCSYIDLIKCVAWIFRHKMRRGSHILRTYPQKHYFKVYANYVQCKLTPHCTVVLVKPHFIMIRFGSLERDYSLSNFNLTGPVYGPLFC